MQEMWVRSLGQEDPLEKLKEVKVAQSCPTLCDPMDCIDSPGQNTGVGSLFLHQGIFLTQGQNPGLLHCRQSNAEPAEPQGKPKNTGVGSLSLLQQIFLTQELNRGLLHFRQILHKLHYQGRPRKQQPILVFLPGKCHKQRSLFDYSPQITKVTNMIECVHACTHTHTQTFSFACTKMCLNSGGECSVMIDFYH